MDSSGKRLLIAAAISFGILLLWQQLYLARHPPPPRPIASTQPASEPEPRIASTRPGATIVSNDQQAGSQPGLATAPATPPQAYAARGGELSVFEIGRDVPVPHGDPNAYWVALRLTSRGAAIESADLTQYRNDAPRKNEPPDIDKTYDLFRPYRVPSEEVFSFGTPTLRLLDAKQDIDLRTLDWRGRQNADGSVAFEAEILYESKAILKIVKTFRLAPASYDLKMHLEVHNLTAKPIAISLVQEGPINLRHESGLRSGPQYDDRVVVTGVDSSGNVTATPHNRPQVLKAEDHRLELSDGKNLRWVAEVNKWFGCIMAPAAPKDGTPLVVVKALATARSSDDADGRDLQPSMILQPENALAAHATAAIDIDAYLGPKDHKLFISNGVYASRGYDTILNATGASCALLTFHWLTSIMRWLLDTLHRVPPHNYGLSIIMLVLIVRIALHGLSKRNQIRMMRMQKKMAVLQPKLEALRTRYANDPQELNRQMMQLYRDEGVSPFGQMAGCLPMFIQMPIWVALWTTLNTTIELRHEPFILWMRDLAAPDALIDFGAPINIPLISYLTGPIASLNILPIVMGLTMYLQQKLTQKLTRPDNVPSAAPPPPSPDGKPSAAEQLKQQQKMMNFMSIFFSLMFYNFPCGLNLYIFTSNLFGMFEQWIIRKEIHASDIEGKPAKSGWFSKKNGGPSKPSSGLMQRFQNWAEGLQKMAEDQRRSTAKPPQSGSDGRAPQKTKRGRR